MFVQIAVAGHQDGNGVAVGDIDQGLDQIPRFELEEGGDLLDCALARGGHNGRGLVCTRSLGGRGFALRAFQVGGVGAGFALHDAILTGLCEDHELVREIAAHGAGVGFDDLGAQPAALEDADVGVVHGLVADIGGFPACIEAVGILHAEFLGAHQAEAGPDLVPEFGLDLVEGFR